MSRSRSTDLDAEVQHRRTAAGEHRVPPAVALLVAAASYALLPGQLLFVPRFVIPALELALLVVLLVSNPIRMTRESRVGRIVGVVQINVVLLTNFVALALLVAAASSSKPSGSSLLLGAMQVWLTNVIGFALLYWELDRGGPVARRRERRDRLPPADWRFSQDENADNVQEVAKTSSVTSGWVPVFVDYLYLSLTNSSAFSPTDTMPLTTRAKLLMGFEATSALLISLLVIARAIGSFGG